MRIALYRFFLVIISFVCFFPLSASAEPVLTIDADRQFEFAEHYFRAGEYYKAIGEYERFIHFCPEDVRVEAAMYNIGLSYFNGEKFQEAIDAFNALLAKFPSTDFRTKAQFKISECLVRLNGQLQAIGYLNDITATAEYKDISDEAYYRRGWIYLEMDRWEEAEESFDLISQKNRDKYRLKTLSREMSKKKDLKTKSPTIAGMLAIIPGAGHLYCGRYKDATVTLILNSAMIYAAYEAFDEGHDVLGGIITFFELGFYSGNIYSAVNCAHKYNKGIKNRFLDYLRENSRIKVGLNSNQKDKAPGLLISYRLTF
ncbi:MAG: tetratricopeptide repeat protein [Deltaproteobacteria bacterium]|nr:tetratricopeptide repeat protein [Deltaproteobacteria bacterium]